ncbi:spore germination lipoprotein GerD [Aneurinibacillus aneurinilyticus]|jgi:spore germination protein D|uniref:Spore germination GerD central core domain-containing protein n=1 Tax=Aneurinibacillus aneurinilyticus ATCC 12856 TaxID=649747 RepID=U1Y7B6_ANEAE|nr:spore germination lipoprotein GerD [Aneurinibacillus aneurinilyticus]ERI06746.1 hypothetical protein HMPREF0083_05118 [Aneurinibacillus aneurinilyticus ATCC 12856]MED0707309.1 spore germination lipoprotein GerD [Aneurinibacillus aneurinilyticus]MED0721644.1 spore germination lipoprotein GerD [Aneurinibacillus aneurinilyticus]MED0731623.1 spore germination lipoprotein GerD [Aneurinibacillus aneurinilyticus]MED0741190.1 spore germination lipoprotein GerD [Aneurinibacillus aneurinilyticus]
MKRFTASKGYILFSILLIAVILAGCGGGKQQKEKSTTASYNETKHMVVDILKTKEGQKAIKEAMKGNRMSTQSKQGAGQGSGAGGEMTIQAHEMMKDPKFAGAMAKAMQEENKKLIKDLMKDPEYQKMMLNTMKDPDYQKMVLETMKSPAYRQQTMAVMKEALQSPMFRLEMINIAQKAQEEMVKPEPTKETKKGKKGEQGGQGKGQGGQGQGKAGGGGGGEK